MSSRFVRRIRGALRREDDPYADTDRASARRFAGKTAALQALLLVAFVSFSHPDARGAALGWAVAAVIIAGSALASRTLARHGDRISDNALLGLSYLAVAVLALMQWLSGGHDAPYVELMLFWVVITAASHPPRRLVTFFAFTSAAALSAVAYESWSSDALSSIGGRLLVWAALGIVVVERVEHFRRQRIGLQRRGDVAHTLALSDSLTELGNRRGFEHALEALKEQTELTGRVHTLVLGDLDGFKEINDRYGHAYGDRCLRAAADVVRSCLRESDGAYRWGGDELAILLPGSDARAARAVCRRISDSLAREVQLPDGSGLGITFGIAELTEAADPNALLDKADVDLMAKKIERANA